MKQRLISNWSLMRWLRLVMGIAILVQALLVNDIPLAIAGILFTALPLFNLGCCGGVCSTSTFSENKKNSEVHYEEVV